MKLPFYKSNSNENGAKECLKMVFRFFGEILLDNNFNSKLTDQNDEEFDLLIQETSELFGLRCIKYSINEIREFKKSPTPFIVKLQNGKYILTYSIKNNKITFADPSSDEIQKIGLEKFLKYFGENLDKIVVFTFQITPKFYYRRSRKSQHLGYYLKFITPYRKFFIQICFGLILGSLLQILPPFLTQVLVDKGIIFKDMSFINLILIGLILIQIGKIISQIIREWITFYIGNRISIVIMSDFLKKIINLPLFFFF